MNDNKRHIHYINPAIQNRLIFSLLIIEIILISTAVFWIYIDISLLIEESMFRVHIQQTLTIGSFVTHLLQASLVLLAVNISIASIIVWYWKSYVKSITSPLSNVANSIKNLDFTAKPSITVQHDVSLIALKWLEREKNKYSTLREQLCRVDTDNMLAVTETMKNCKDILEQNCNQKNTT